MIESINSTADPLVSWCVVGIGALFAIGMVIRFVHFPARNEREHQRTEAYNMLIAADNALLDGDITQREYNQIHDAFYAEFPGGDVSL